MNSKPYSRLLRGAPALLLFSFLAFALSLAQAQNTAFTYQGRLNDGANPANGIYDLRFAVYDALSAGSVVGGPITNSATAVTNGLFTVTLDFGAGVFSGANRWLDISVRTNGAAAFGALAPRQAITPAPYSLFAESVGAGGLPAGTYGNAVTFNNSGNSFSGNGTGLTSVNAATLNGFGYCSLPCYWNLSGNAATSPTLNFLGTTDNQPLTLKVNNSSALQFRPGNSGPNVVGGLAGFHPTFLAPGVSGAVVAGGNAPSGGVNGFGAVDFHAVFDNDGTVGGGFGNKVGSDDGDLTDAAFATVGGGVFNTASGYAATVAGGDGNQSAGVRSAVAGGTGNVGIADYSSLGGGQNNLIQTNSSWSTIAGGKNNAVKDWSDAVVGLSTTPYAVIGGGEGNTIWPLYNPFNTVLVDHSVIGGGYSNTVRGSLSVIPGGQNNEADGTWSFAAGQRAKAYHSGAFVWADSQNADFASTAGDQFCIRAQGGVQLSPNTSLFCGNQTRQMLNLWGTQYGIGVQTLTTYFRTDFGFSWFKGGVHNDGQNNPGGGKETMRLDSNGNLNISGGFGSLSDRNAKERFEPVNPRAVLDEVTSLPLSRWSYKTDPETRHLGPMAQDFFAAFELGTDDKHIGLGDEGGVALAAIQGLNEKVQSQNAELRAENAGLKQRLERLEKLVLKQSSSQ